MTVPAAEQLGGTISKHHHLALGVKEPQGSRGRDGGTIDPGPRR